MIQPVEPTISDVIERDRAEDEALVSITAALCACQRAGFPPAVLDRLLEAKAAALKVTQEREV